MDYKNFTEPLIEGKVDMPSIHVEIHVDQNEFQSAAAANPVLV